MDWSQVTIPLGVSIIFWILTFILPYLFPSQFSWIILVLKKRHTLKDPSEIRLYVNQFFKYDDWKMLTAKGMLLSSFERKLDFFKKEEKEYWQVLKDKIEIIPIKGAIKEIEDELRKLNQPIIVNGEPYYKGFTAVTLSKVLESYQDWYKKNKKINVWRFKEISLEDFENNLDLDSTKIKKKASEMSLEERLRSTIYYPNVIGGVIVDNGYTPKDFVKLIGLREMVLTEEDGRWTHGSNEIASKDNFLTEIGLKKSIEINQDEIYKSFNKILLNLDLSDDINKKGFSIALSDMDESMEIFEKIFGMGNNITSLKTEILIKIEKIMENAELKYMETQTKQL